MDDFKTMFPNMDYDIIECVLRANSGAVDATIDQLLQMNLEAGGGSVYEDSSDSEDSIPPEILERTLEPDSSDEEPPPVYSPPAYHMHMFDRPYPLAPPTPPPRIDVLGSVPPSGQRRYRNWNPPLLGNLPEDFLRILPQQLDSIQATSGGSKPAITEGGRPLTAGPGPRDQENRWKQYLEDERIALFLQNEEFMKELQRNRDFLLALERDRLKYESQKSTSSSVAVGNDFDFPAPVPAAAATHTRDWPTDWLNSLEVPGARARRGHTTPRTSDNNPAVSEDALFRDKLKHMGKSTRRKLFELARAFSEKTKMRKSKRKHLLKHQSLGAAASTANLLDDVEGHTCDEDFRGRRQEVPKVEEALREGQ
ncbi:CUE domain-containing protein 1 isoform X1 [Neophocaena asiaeorientalis asiaeorientalis]|uniref:CUE domain-containing protein 1 isoform X1 n=1 Tax=Neophocaena asiaeorientalis asiaeorientalis TaxID=1706337 RepID=A0A341CFB7_NEOAA|nr:CUE domain-containing protein 1 isoform X1 [Neophocaena asiaeorientalis asiaeorientalis]